MVFDFDYHVHTTLSYCHEGELTVDNFINLARLKGIKGFTVTDHAHHLYFDEKSAWQYDYIKDYNLFLKASETGDSKFEGYLDMLTGYKEKLSQTNDLKLLIGTEIDVAKNGKVVFNTKYRNNLDILIGGIHWLPCLNDELNSKTLLIEFMDFTMMLLESDIDILAHPTRIFRAHKMEIPKEVTRPIVMKAKEKGVALEINSHNYPDPDVHFIRTCVDEGVKLSLGTDTHRIAEFGDFSIQKKILSEAGISEDKLDDVIFKHKGILS
jgi:histidinol phosphatase-like PHP family hydrolase